MASKPAVTTNLVSGSAYVYQQLLKLYPEQFRADYAGPMLQLFRDTARDRVLAYGLWGLVALWLYTLGDLIKSLVAEHGMGGSRMLISKPKRKTIVFTTLLALYWPFMWYGSVYTLNIPEFITMNNPLFDLVLIFSALLLREFTQQLPNQRLAKLLNKAVLVTAIVAVLAAVPLVGMYARIFNNVENPDWSLYESQQSFVLLYSVFWLGLDIFYLLIALTGVLLIVRRQYLVGLCWLITSLPYIGFMVGAATRAYIGVTTIASTMAWLGISVILLMRWQVADVKTPLALA